MTQAELRDFMVEHFDPLEWNRGRHAPIELPKEVDESQNTTSGLAGGSGHCRRA